jgi:hypothetical protein
MLFACASFSLLGFPLDDGWHRIFGQDVTLWGPTHLRLFGGAGMTLIGRASLLVEGVAFLISTRKPIRFGAWCGVAIGTIGFASEWAWSHIWMPIPWPSSLMPEALIWAIVAGVSGGLLGALIGSALGSDRKPFPRRGVKATLAVGFVAIFAMVGYGLHVNNDAQGATAHFQLRNVDGGPGRYVQARVTLDPRTAAGDPRWVSVTAWQGGGLVVNRLKKLSEGVYETTKPIPVNGDWKALLRIHKNDAILGAPIYLPNDPAIPAKEVPAKADMTRPLVADHKILQRESKSASGILPLLAYLGVLAIALGLCALMTWGLGRLARDGDAGVSGPEPETSEAWIQRPRGTGAPTTA